MSPFRFLKERLGGPNLKGYGMSVIIPFRQSAKFPRQNENFEWVKRYWACQLPGAQVIVGKDRHRDRPFSKSAAVNDGFKHASGDIIAVTDADCYISAEVAALCAKEIRRARNMGRRLWFIPYRKFFRLTDQASRRVLDSDPCCPYEFPTPPKPRDEDSTGYHPTILQEQFRKRHCWSGSKRGHWYGAMIHIFPREAFEEVRGWDPRFRGWGGEDHSAMRAMDTLYWRHKTTYNQVLHLWHPMLSQDGVESWVDWKNRLWDGQPSAGTNGQLASRYSHAFGDAKRMRKLLDEGLRADD